MGHTRHNASRAYEGLGSLRLSRKLCGPIRDVLVIFIKAMEGLLLKCSFCLLLRGQLLYLLLLLLLHLMKVTSIDEFLRRSRGSLCGGAIP